MGCPRTFPRSKHLNISYERAPGAYAANQEIDVAAQYNICAANQETAEQSTTSVQLHMLPLLRFDSRAMQRAHNARTLQPAALAFVSYGFVLVRVRVETSVSAGAPAAKLLPT